MGTPSTKKIEFWATIAIFWSFFLPWTTGFEGSRHHPSDAMALTGYQVADLMRMQAVEMDQMEAAKAKARESGVRSAWQEPSDTRSAKEKDREANEKLAAHALPKLMYFAAFMGLICAASEMCGGGFRVFYLLASLTPWVLFGIAISFYFANSDGEFTDKMEIFARLSVGAWLMLLATIAAFVGVVRPAPRRAPPLPASY